jgi:transcriptional regulator with XRE-family HTH domain
MSGRSLVERVIAERQQRGLTIRQAAGLTDITNTTWSRWENEAGDPSPKLRTAVATAFGWGQDWPENPPPLPVPTDHGVTLADIDEKLEMLIEGRLEIATMVTNQLAAAAETFERALLRISARLDALERPQTPIARVRR